jgi:hypothetical protein
MASNAGFSHNARAFEEVAPSRGVSQEMSDSGSEDQEDSSYDEEMTEEETDQDDADQDESEEEDEEEEEVEAKPTKKGKAKITTEEDLNKLRSTKDKELEQERKERVKLQESNKKLQEALAKQFQENAERDRLSFEWSIANDPPDQQQIKRNAFAAFQRENLMKAQLEAKDMQIENMLQAFQPMAKDKVLQLISQQVGVPVELLAEYNDPAVAEAVAKVHASYLKDQKAKARKSSKKDTFEGGGGASKAPSVKAKFVGTGDIAGWLAAQARQRRR